MSKRSLIRITTYMIAAVTALTALTIINTGKMNYYKNQLEVNYRHSLAELGECMDAVNTDLTKSVYANSPEEMRTISRDLFAQCSTSKNAISRLPVAQMELSNTYKFLTQASDYAQYIGAKIESGKSINEQEHRNLLALLRYAETLNTSVRDMRQLAESGAKITEGKVKNEHAPIATPLSLQFSESAKTFESFPTLLYDGPYSDQVLQKKSTMLSTAPVTAKEACTARAADCLQVPKQKIIFAENESSRLPCYTFKSGRYTVSVTKQGGYIKSMLYSGIANQKNITEENAVNLAKNFLTRIGYPQMEQTYYSTQDNICTINFAFSQNDVLYYPDLIKCGVSLETGAVVTLDAATFLTNHTQRTAFSPKLSEKQARAYVSPYLQIKNSKRCVIPKENGTQAACYEFTCTSNDTGEDTLIYINQDTGVEEDILLLLYTDNGTLVK